MSHLLKDLNDKQREAVTAPMGPVLILAGAGSGKTRALTYRIAYLLSPYGRSPEGGEPLFQPEDILALTFTNKAAGEMKERVHALLGDSRQHTVDSSGLRSTDYGLRITMGTFHSVCVRILRKDIEALGAGYDRHFVIYDAQDQQKLVKQIVLELDLSDQFKHQVFAYYISQAKTRMVEPARMDLGKEYFQEKLQEVYEEYQRRLREHNALDFDDLLNVTVSLFQRSEKTLAKYQKRFKYILVDEYQDTNHAQYLLLKLLAKKHKNLFVVGDDAQSIYGFRGANMRNILDFKKDYKQAQVVKLEQNYRSTQNILSAANQVIRLNKSQYEKDLWTENTGGDKIHLYEAEDNWDEAEFVVNQLVDRRPRTRASSVRGRQHTVDSSDIEYDYNEADEDYGILSKYMKKPNRRAVAYQIPNTKYAIPDDLSEIVILYRTHAQSRSFEEALISAGIPYQIVGGVKFYERKEIKDALAYLRLILNPRDLVSLQRVIGEPPRGIGRVSFKEIKRALDKYQFSFKRLLNNLDELDLSTKALEGAREFFRVLADSRQQTVDSSGLRTTDYGLRSTDSVNILDQIEFILRKSGYKDYILDGSEEGYSRWENIEELFSVAAKYKNQPWQEGLHLFLEEAALMTDLDQMEDETNQLTLMTLHSAKGLEFDKVFFVGLEEGLLPHSRSLLDPRELAEEIRLAYVGMTRARQKLYLSWAKNRRIYGEVKNSTPSRVLKAIPDKLIQKINST